jgi:protease-4
MGSTAASGGYYIACAAQEIFANPGTLTGSIGAVMQFMKMKVLYEKIGIEYQTIKSGEYKDIGASQRNMTPAERNLIQKTVNDVRTQFIQAIIEGRSDRLTRNQIEAFADGRIFTGKQASEKMLIDRLGNLQDTIAHAAQVAGIKGEPKITRIKHKVT